MMRAISQAIVIATVIALCRVASAAYPTIDSPVTDQAGVLHPQEIERISALLVDHRERTGVQMAVLVVASTQPEPIEDFSIKVAEAWGGGSKGRDDGILFVLAVRDRRMRLEVGYGLEAVIPDRMAKHIIDTIIPTLRAERYGSGVERVVRSVINRTAFLKPGEGVPFSYKLGRFFNESYIMYFVLGIALGFLPLFVMRRVYRPRGRRPVPRSQLLAVIGSFVAAYLGAPIAIGVFTGGAWYWNPILYCVGIVHGIAMWLAWRPKRRKYIIVPIIIAIMTIAVGAVIYHYLHSVGPSYGRTSSAETFLLMFLVMAATIGYPIMFMIAGGVSPSEGTTYSGSSSYSSSSSFSSSSSYSSSSYSSSSSSSSSGYSGGGGSFGGGGASSSW